ncbi:Pentatricopeptide repeat-containing protein [Actinidia chinensis var. chinensis]|uniref:Pentatricopeptide repeat-containing protein n=1 Tax=Actinidia chinensis var. chinensis TaxID=1590841 RepID=A0A2R6QDY9_ACTCC|nr:Pentatricopeptide repeat-containing protein [Actinidia chinensis var. chinensis]
MRFPLVSFWAGALAKSTRNNHSHHKRERWAGLLYNIGCYDIMWQTYLRLRGRSVVPSSLSEQLIVGRFRTIMVSFEKVAYHHSDLSPRQFGLGEDFMCYLSEPLRPISFLHNRSGPKIGKDWAAFKAYKDYNDTWNQRRSLLIDFHGASSVEAGGSHVAADSPNVTSLSNHTTLVEQQPEVESANVASQGSPRSPLPYRPAPAVEQESEVLYDGESANATFQCPPWLPSPYRPTSPFEEES